MGGYHSRQLLLERDAQLEALRAEVAALRSERSCRPRLSAASDARIVVSLNTLAEQPLLGCLDVEVAAQLLMCLPLDARLRAREVSRGWRALLNEPRFWTVLDFSLGSGVVARMSRALLFAAGERGRGHLHKLELSGDEYFWAEDLVQFAAVHGQNWRSVTAPESLWLHADQVTRLCRSAPFCTLRCYVKCSAAEALPLLRCEAPCALLHIFKLKVGEFNNNQRVLDFAAALLSHSGKIKELIVRCGFRVGAHAVADALMRGIAEARVSDVSFDSSFLTPASLPGLTRLLQAGCLEKLEILNFVALFVEGPDLTAFCHALRSCRLHVLKLNFCEVWLRPAVAVELMVALVGHQTLRELSLSGNTMRDNRDDTRRAAGEQLAFLINHNSALQQLDLSLNRLGEAGLAPILEALPRSSTLKELVYSVGRYETISREFARDVILPAVRANTSLRALRFGHDEDHDDETLPEFVEAQAIVDARTQPDVTAIV